MKHVVPDLGILFRTGPVDAPTYTFACGCRFQSEPIDFADGRRFRSVACGRDHARTLAILHGFSPILDGDTIEWEEGWRLTRRYTS